MTFVRGWLVRPIVGELIRENQGIRTFPRGELSVARLCVTLPICNVLAPLSTEFDAENRSRSFRQGGLNIQNKDLIPRLPVFRYVAQRSDLRSVR